MRLYSIELVVRQDGPDEMPRVDARLDIENDTPQQHVEAEIPALLRHFADHAEQRMAQPPADATPNTEQTGDNN